MKGANQIRGGATGNPLSRRRPETLSATRGQIVVDGAAQDAPAEMMMEMGQRRGPDDRASQVRLGHRAFLMKRPTKIASGTDAAHQAAKATSQGIHAASEGSRSGGMRSDTESAMPSASAAAMISDQRSSGIWFLSFQPCTVV